MRELPDNYRSLFNFPVFNAVQSKCFQNVYKSDDNVVLAAPTGSGKTVVMELAICRLQNMLKNEQFKIDVNTNSGGLMGFEFAGNRPDGLQIYRNFYVNRNGGDVYLRATLGNRLSGESETANWQFHGCR